MKKIITGVAFFLLAFTTQAQTEKSNWLMGGNMSFQSLNSGGTQADMFAVTPSFGYFVINNLAVGLNADYAHLKMEEMSSLENFSAGPFVRYYFVSLGSKAKLFANGRFNYGFDKGFDGGSGTRNFIDWGVTAGPSLFLSKCVAVEFAVGYTYNKYKSEDNSTDGITSNIGFQIHFKP